MNGLYIHIPFCIRKCNYCDFASYPSCRERSAEYISALFRDMSAYCGEEVDTIYFGGGTPSLLPSGDIERILTEVHSTFKLTQNSEITLEVNPGTIDVQKARDFKKMGINRISLGAQSFINSELSALGRVHSADDTIRAYDELRTAGFDNISFDLMYAIHNQNISTLSTSIAQMLKLAPEHISCYGLKIEEGTPFYTMLERGEISEHSDDSYADMYELIRSELANAGYEQYELSNFSKKGFESKHNLKYWTLNDYIGIGLSAASCFKGCRYTKTSDFNSYVSDIENAEYSCPDADERMSEYMILSLRLTKIGAKKSEFKSMFGREISEVFGKTIEQNISKGLLYETEDSYLLTPKAYYISNMVLMCFI